MTKFYFMVGGFQLIPVGAKPDDDPVFDVPSASGFHFAGEEIWVKSSNWPDIYKMLDESLPNPATIAKEVKLPGGATFWLWRAAEPAVAAV